MRVATTALSLIALAIILSKSGVFDALLMFVIVGAIPSTAFAFSPSTMLAIVLATIWLTLIQISLAVIESVGKRRPSSSASTYRISPAVRRRLYGRLGSN